MIKKTKTGRDVQFPFGWVPPVGFVYDTADDLKRGKAVNKSVSGFSMVLIAVNYALTQAAVYEPSTFFAVLVAAVCLHIAGVWLFAPHAGRYDKARDGELVNPNLAKNG